LFLKNFPKGTRRHAVTKPNVTVNSIPYDLVKPLKYEIFTFYTIIARQNRQSSSKNTKNKELKRRITYRAFHWGSRFSKRARIPSRASSESLRLFSTPARY